MRRGWTFFLLVAMLAATASAAVAARPPTPKSLQTRTFYVVAGAERFECALSSDPALADPSRGCSNRYEAATESVLGSEPTWIPALDGLPVSLDVTRPIHGTIEVSSRYLVGYVVGPIGVGQAQLRVTIAGIAGGRAVTVGSFTSETYTVTPAEDEYEVEFEIEPDTALAGARFTELRIGLEVLGPNVNHNFFDADAKSSVTVPLVR